MGPDKNSKVWAGLDLGSNSLRLQIVQPAGEGEFEQIDAGRSTLRLANDAFDTGRFSEKTIERLKGAMAAFASAMYGQDVTRYRSVATEAFRRAANHEEAAERVREAAGIRIETISSEEEARLVLVAVRAELGDLEGAPPLVVDLGGGSLDLILDRGEGKEPLLESHALGLAARFESFLAERVAGEEVRRGLGQEAARIGERLDSAILDDAPEGAPVVFVGGQAAMLDLLAEQWGMWSAADSTRDGAPLDAFDTFYERLAGTPPEILEGLRIPADRAPMLTGAAALYRALAVRVGSPSMRLPRTGLMDGLLRTIGEEGHPWPPEEEQGVDKRSL
ncbi:MAG: hypothetical protein R6W82_06080 [bacterium]